jgi:hypothetical protein
MSIATKAMYFSEIMRDVDRRPNPNLSNRFEQRQKRADVRDRLVGKGVNP